MFLVFALTVALADFAGAQANGGAFITNGTVMLGVNRDGSLNVPGGPRSTGPGITTTVVGVRYVPTGAEGTADGCSCEGWGVADKLTGAAGGANQTSHGLTGFGLTLESFTANATTATSVVRINSSFRVTHRYSPSPSPNLYQVDVTIENISSATTTVMYRRSMDWDIEPTAFSEFVTIVAKNPATGLFPKNLTFSSDNGFADARVLTHPGSLFFISGPTGADRIDSGPFDHGALFDFNFGSVAAGASKTFRIFYGAAGSEAAALGAIAAVGAEMYSLGQPNVPGGATTGAPNTFIFAFTGVGGSPIVPATSTTTALTPSATSSSFGAPLTLTATVEATEGTTAPLGTVQFRDGASVLATAALTPINGTVHSTATFTTSSLDAGTRSIAAVYAGGNFSGAAFRVSEAPPVAIVIAPAGSTTSLASTANPSMPGEAVTFAASVRPVAPSSVIPTGSLQFQVDDIDFGSPVPLNAAGNATFTTSSLRSGRRRVAAIYRNNANFTSSAASLTQVVNPAPTTTTLAASPGTATFAETVSFTATVTGGTSPVSEGAVTFKDGATVLAGPMPLDAQGQATFSTAALAAGSHTITASYSEDAAFGPSEGIAHLVINRATPSFADVSRPTIVFGTASVSVAATLRAGSLVPTGNARIMLNGVAHVAALAGDGGIVTTFDTSVLGAGSYALEFVYDGDANFNSASAAATLVVNKAVPAFDGLVGAAITFGARSFPSGGHLAAGSLVPTGSVHLTLNGVTQPAGIQPDGTFNATLNAAALGAGTYVVRLTYDGDSNFTAAEAALELVVRKAAPTIEVGGGTFVYDGAPHGASFSVRGVENALLGPVTVTYGGSTDVPVRAGTYAVVVSYGGDANYEAVSDRSASIEVRQAALTIVADDASRVVGAPNPSFTARYVGFVAGEGAAQLVGSLLFTTPATETSSVGTYPIVPSGVTSPNYEITFVSGTLAVGYDVRVLYDTTKAHKSGSTVPLKLQLSDAAGRNVSSPAVVLMATNLVQISAAATLAVEDSGNANPDVNFRYDASLAGYIFNLQVSGLATGTYRMVFSVAGDPTPHATQFQVR